MPGYDWVGLFVGSEGTLGIATEITLRLLKAPAQVQVLLADFNSVEAAGAAVSDIIAAGIIPAGLEIMDNFSINAVEDVVQSGCYPRDAAAILLVEVDGLELEVEEASQQVKALCLKNGARQVQVASSPEERARLWKGRKAAFAAMGKLSPNYYVQDGVIPRSQLAYVLKEIERLSREYGYPVANVFHAGDGNLHPLILYDESVPGSLEQVEKLGARSSSSACVWGAAFLASTASVPTSAATCRRCLRPRTWRACSGCGRCSTRSASLTLTRSFPLPAPAARQPTPTGNRNGKGSPFSS